MTTSICAFVNSASWSRLSHVTTAETKSLPGCGIQHGRIFRIDLQIDKASRVVYKQNLVPRFPAVSGLKDSAFIVSAPLVTHCGNVDRVRLCGMDDNCTDLAAVCESHVRPGLSAV